jgi:hypothetical protein
LQAVLLRASTRIECLTANRAPNQYQRRLCQCLWAVGLCCVGLLCLWAWGGGVFWRGWGAKFRLCDGRWGEYLPVQRLDIFCKMYIIEVWTYIN